MLARPRASRLHARVGRRLTQVQVVHDDVHEPDPNAGMEPARSRGVPGARRLDDHREGDGVHELEIDPEDRERAVDQRERTAEPDRRRGDVRSTGYASGLSRSTVFARMSPTQTDPFPKATSSTQPPVFGFAQPGAALTCAPPVTVLVRGSIRRT